MHGRTMVQIQYQTLRTDRQMDRQMDRVAETISRSACLLCMLPRDKDSVYSHYIII